MPQWAQKKKQKFLAQLYQQKAPLVPEFGQIICIGFGYFLKKEEKEKQNLEPDKLHFRVKGVMVGWDNIPNERALLIKAQEIFKKFFRGSSSESPRFSYLAGHNIKLFDIPYLCKRMVIHQLIPLPPILNLQNVRYSEEIIDTLELWQFGDYRNPRLSLQFLTQLFQVPSPKEEMDGSVVNPYYWEAIQQNEKDRSKQIYSYCLNDVIAIANLILRWRNLPPLEKSQITFLFPEAEETEEKGIRM